MEMTEKILTQERLKELLHYNPETGIFNWKVKIGSVLCGNEAGCIMHNGYGYSYIVIGINKKSYRAHRLVWLYVNGHLPNGIIDHKDHDGLNNKITNLRDTSYSGNGKNRVLGKNNTSGCIGVSWNKSLHKWRASISIDRNPAHIGYFDSYFEAVCARKSAEGKYNYFAED